MFRSSTSWNVGFAKKTWFSSGATALFRDNGVPRDPSPNSRSSTSSQESEAFDARQKKSKRKTLGRNTSRSMFLEAEVNPALEPGVMKYPMYVMPVPTLLSETHLRPHQELLNEGLLMQRTKDMRGKIIFVSHQWLSYQHPDPDGSQFKVLQRILSRLIAGDVSVVKAHWMHQHLFDGQTCTVTAQEWMDTLPDMYVWLDYMSMPQPSVVGKSAGASEASHAGFTDKRITSDGATKEETRVAQQLALAVSSIPAYVECSTLLLILAPVCKHADTGATCSFGSWRERGWCRMELMSGLLSRNDIHAMVCTGPEALPYFLMPSDALNMPAGRGSFTCCSLGHDLNGKKIKCDKHAVKDVLTKMFDARVDHLQCKRRGTSWRFLFCMRHQILQGLPESACSDGTRLSVQLRDWKADMKWTSQDEKDSKKTGWSLLSFAALAGNTDVMRGLLEDGGIDVRKPIQKGRYDLGILPGTTPLMLSMCYARWEVVQLLLDRNVDSHVCTGGPGLDALMFACKGNNVENVVAWLDRFPQWPLERQERYAGMTALFIAVHSGDCRSEVASVLLNARAEIAPRSRIGATALHYAAYKHDSDVDLVRLLLQHKSDPNQPVKPRSWRWHFRLLYSRVAVRFGNRSADMHDLARLAGSTPLHFAVARGDMHEVEVLITHGAQAAARNQHGETARSCAFRTFDGRVPADMCKLLYSQSALSRSHQVCAAGNADDTDGELVGACTYCSDAEDIKLSKSANLYVDVAKVEEGIDLVSALSVNDTGKLLTPASSQPQGASETPPLPLKMNHLILHVGKPESSRTMRQCSVFEDA